MATSTRRSNLRCFLDNVTPSVETQVIFRPPNYGSSSWQYWWGDQDYVEYYTLSDLWGSLYEWSAYGASTDVLLPNGETVVQYFVPYLSAIQLYTNEMSPTAARHFALHNGMYGYGDEHYNQQLSQSWNSLPIDSLLSQMNLGSDEKKNLGCKYFEYFETSSPYKRVPLGDKVRELAQNFPGLNCFKSMELSPSSWMSISWYPIYTIPAQLERENYGSCFLTYHNFSSLPDDAPDETMKVTSNESLLGQNKKKQKNKALTISLPPFGLASHKVNRALWNNPETGDGALAASLLCAAGSWLRKVQAEHHDFNFFITH